MSADNGSMREVVIAGVGMTAFGKFLDRGVKSLVAESVGAAVADAGGAGADRGIEMIYYANTASGVMHGQHSVRGQHAMREAGLNGIPLINIENACASGSTALNQAWLAVGSGQVDVALAVGAEKLYHPDKARAFAAMSSALDQDRLDEIFAEIGGGGGDRSAFMDVYAKMAIRYMERTGATQEDFARVAVKNHDHGALNPKAQYRTRFTLDEVMAARPISGPLTLPMCSPIGDGSAAVIVTTPEIAARWGAEAVTVLATRIGASNPGIDGELVPGVARRAFEQAGIAPSDVDVLECHDATAPAELIVLEELGLAEPGRAVGMLRRGDTRIGGALPVNPSGGLESKGHPIGASGLAQVVELADQLRGRCGARQVDGARIGVAENAGGYMGPDAAVATVTILGAR
ncbi:MAG TPA: thiolase family protein [Pseudonocardia sp.]|jgi:acetyl-CoA acetyltransferase